MSWPTTDGREHGDGGQRRLLGEGTRSRDLYAARRDRFARERDELTRRWNRVANLRLVAFLAGVVGLIWTIAARSLIAGALAAIGFAAFVALVRVHRDAGRRRRRAAILHDLNDEAERRGRRAWHELPLRHNAQVSPDHPFAADLDLFGRASLFQLLETVATPMGEATLREWLLQPASPEVVRERQAAVAELTPLLDWRQDLAWHGRLAGEERPDPEPFLRWAEGDRWLQRRPLLVWAARASVTLLAVAAALDVLGVTGPPVWVAFLAANLALTQVLGREAHGRIAVVAAHHDALVSSAGLLAHLGSADFTAAALRRLHDELVVDGSLAHEEVRRLHRLTAWATPRSSLAYLPLQAVFCWDLHVLDALERWQASAGARVRRWLGVIGEVEALAALAALAYDHPDWAFPVVDPDAEALVANGLGHPLLSDDVRVVNDVTVGPPGTFLLVTGSNMSGKSTLLRAIGVNVVLAGSGGPVCAASLRVPPVALWTCMRVQDSLERGVSLFMAELLRLKQIVDTASAADPAGRRVFFLLDEILQGTNTAERQIAARRVIRALVDLGAIGAVSTHDLMLAEGPELADVARPVHFRETIADGPEGPVMNFDYLLRPGLATSTNALRLMELVGFDVSAAGTGRR